MEEVWLIQLDWPDMGKMPTGIYLTFAYDINKNTFPRIHIPAPNALQPESNVVFWVRDLGLKAHGLPDVAAILKGPVTLNSAHVTSYSYRDVCRGMRNNNDTRYPAEVAKAFTEIIRLQILRHQQIFDDRRVQVVRMPLAPIQTTALGWRWLCYLGFSK